jgi:hypothetical protein
MVHPAAFLGLIVVKKIGAVAIYQALAKYGFPRAYRRALELNRRVTPAAQQAQVQHLVKAAFYAPGKAYELLENNAAFALVQRGVQEVRSHGVVGGAAAFALKTALSASNHAQKALFRAVLTEAEKHARDVGAGIGRVVRRSPRSAANKAVDQPPEPPLR